jgi:hypothetical protein
LSWLRSIFLLGVLGALAIVMCTSTVSAASNTQYVFGRADFPTGNRPTGIAQGDFNGDGKRDLVVANESDNTVSVFLGQSNGTLGPKTDFDTGTYPVYVVVGDFNSDGKVDVAVVDSCGQSCGFVSILLSNGDGTFQPHVDYATGNFPLGAVVGDFNGDGILDVAIVDSCGTTCGFISILLGKGDGTFLTKTDYPVGQTPGAIVAQDFNGDGKPDLAVSNSSNSVSVLLGNGDGTFRAHVDFPSAATPWGIAAGDVTGDKIPDLIVTHSGVPWAATILKGNGDGTFQPEQQVATELATPELSAVDLNGDGKLDLVFAVVSVGGVEVFLGNGDGTFQPEVNYTTGGYPFAVTVQDMNGDGNLDMVVADQDSNYVTVLLGNGDGTFSPKTSLPLGPFRLDQLSAAAAVVGDFNGDGIADLAVDEVSYDYTGTGVVSVLLGKGKGVFQSPVNTNSNGANGTIVAGDFNGDGRLDVALSTGNGAAVMLGNGDGTFGMPVQIVNTQGVPAPGVVVGDFNNDGKQDLLVVANGFLQANPIYVLLGNGDGTFQPPKQFWSSTSVPSSPAAADFNHDGKLDLVVDLNSTGIAVMLGNGDGTFQAPVIYATDGGSGGGLTVADVNGDGIPDIIATGNQIDVFLGKGDGTFSNLVSYNGGSFPEQIITGDFNADGKLDIAVAAEGTGATGNLEILLGNGDGTFQPPVEIADGYISGLLAVGDLNQDGTADIFVPGTPGSLFLSGPIATLNPFSINFGPLVVGSTSPTQSLLLSNSGNAPLELTSITTTSGYAVTNTCGGSVAVSSSCTANVTFGPAGLGGSTGLLTITDSAPRGQQTIALAGTGEASFSLAVASGSSNPVTVSPGGQANYSLVATPLAGVASTVAFSCSGAPPQATCVVSPSSVMLAGTAATIAVLVSTAGPTTAMDIPLGTVFGNARPLLFSLVAIFLGAIGVVLRRRPRVRTQIVVLNLGILLAITACGRSGSSGPTGTPAATPPGTYSFNVSATSGTGAATTQQIVQLALIVN